MKTKLNIHYLNIGRQIDIIEERIQEGIKRFRDLIWSDFEEHFSHDEQMKIIGFFGLITAIGIFMFFIAAFKFAILFFLLILVIEYFLYNNIKNFIKRNKRIEKIREEMQEMRNDF